MNPFKEKPMQLDSALFSWKKMYPKPLDKRGDPYTKARVILMNGTEFDANWNSHCFLRHTDDYALRQEISFTRFIEKEQQQMLNMLKPVEENMLETTIGYEQLAVDLTAELAKREKDFEVKKALDFALLEDFDHLYRYSNLLESDYGVRAEELVGGYTEITPARPTLAHHRHPIDNPRRNILAKKSDKQTVLNTMIITAAEQQTMNFYMNLSSFYKNDEGRKLFQEIALVEEEHVTQYGSLMDSTSDFFEMCLWHEYNECYLYWSCYMTETNKNMKLFWEENLQLEIAHLHKAVELMKKYGKKDYDTVIPDGKFPEPISLHENIDYVRDIIDTTAQFTSKDDAYIDIADLKDNDRFFEYQKIVNSPISCVPSHNVIERNIAEFKEDYRFEKAPNPLKPLQKRDSDNTSIGVKPQKLGNKGFVANK